MNSTVVVAISVHIVLRIVRHAALPAGRLLIPLAVLVLLLPILLPF